LRDDNGRRADHRGQDKQCTQRANTRAIDHGRLRPGSVRLSPDR
jgi:hypothetical protein